MTLMKIHGGRIVREVKHDGLYNDMLTSTFEQDTGLYLSL